MEAEALESGFVFAVGREYEWLEVQLLAASPSDLHAGQGGTAEVDRVCFWNSWKVVDIWEPFYFGLCSPQLQMHLS